MTDLYHTDYSDLYEQLEAAQHSVSYAHHLMQIDPSDATILGYEQSLDYAAAIRIKIGQRNEADMDRRSRAACI